MESKSSSVLIAYVASPHAGYLKFFRAYEGSILYILGNEFIREFPALVRHLPGVNPYEARRMLESLDISSSVHVLTLAMLATVRESPVVMPDEDVSHAFAEKYLPDQAITFDGNWRLRWDWGATQKNRRPEGERVISVDELDRELMRSAFREANCSPDWWRQIGALLVDENGGVILAAFNHHVPSEQSAYCYGDPRSNFEPGQCIDASLSLHAEAGIFAEACRRGIKTEGCDLYVTTFPCPPCAYLSSFTGIRRLYYVDGYALVAGAEALQAKDVEIIRVQM
ncbi:MAG: deaminase [Candidatus Parcubacteria bacterium]|nr:deaminase [Candidatus Parcubacteria bacterium]